MNVPKPDRPNRPQRWPYIGAAVILLAVLVVLAIPSALSSRSGRTWLLGKADRALAPGRFHLATLSFSWFGPTRMTGFELLDEKGDRVVFAPRATWDRTMRQVLFERPKLGTLRLDGAVIEAERGSDGSIDLVETLRPIAGLNPKTGLRILLPDGKLRFRGKGLEQPVVAERAEIVIDIVPTPGPISWQARLANGPTGSPNSTLAIEGAFVRGTVPESKLDLRVLAKQWPWGIGGERLGGSGRLDCEFRASKASGRWSTSGEASVADVEATGRWLLGDRLRVAAAKGVWDVLEAETGWSVRRFDFDSSVATFKGAGSFSPADRLGGSVRVEGRVDLAALAAQLPHAFRLREGVSLEQGTAEVKGETKDVQGTPVLDLSAKLSDLRASDHGRPFALKEPATIAARLRRPGDVIEVERFTVESAFLQAEARGDLFRGVNVTGSVDLEGLQRQFRDLIDFGSVKFAGRGGVTGLFKADRGRYQGRVETDLHAVRVSALERDAVGLTLDIDGPSDSSGLPGGWTGLRSKMISGNVTAELTARSDGPTASLVVAGLVPLPDRRAKAEGRVEARWDSGVVMLDPITVTLAAVDAKNPPLRFAAKGVFDRSHGLLTLTPAPSTGRNAPVALSGDGLRVSGLGGEFRLDGEFAGELAGLGPWIPSVPEGLRGRWSARTSGRSSDDGIQLGGRVDIAGLGWGSPVTNPGSAGSVGEPIGMAVRAFLPRESDQLDLSEFVLTSRYATLEASGKFAELSGRRLADLNGKISPDWKAINTWLAANIEPGAKLIGKPRTFRLHAPLGDDWTKGADGEVGFAVDGADIYGMKFGPTALVLRARDGKLGIDPIDTSVNEGRLHLEPSIRTGDDPAIVLGNKSTLTDVKVNDEVSRRVLSFVAPVLDNATRVRGRVSASIDEAVFPLAGKAGGNPGPTVDGAVVFQDVEFMPGLLLNELYQLIGRDERPVLKLTEPVSLSIADRRVYQDGLSIPIGKLTRVEMEGWVGFDKTLNLTASIPILPTMLTDTPLLGGIADGAKVRVPIRGTLDKPQVDREAFKLGMRDMGRSLLEKGVSQGAADLLQRMTRGRDPDAPPLFPRLNLEERRARQMERRAERRQRRGLPP